MDSLYYIEVSFTFEPFTEEGAEIVEAVISELPFDSFVMEFNCLKAYIPKDQYDPRELKMVLMDVPFAVSFSSALVQPQNWNARWESEGFTPIVAAGVTVKSWDDKTAPKTRLNIRLSPQMAFGTGHHETTRMMIRSMMEEEGRIRGHAVTDMGCGTGVLSLLAAKLGAAKVKAIDIDAVAARSAYDNALLNRLSRRIEVCCGDASLLQMGSADVLLANIHRNIILQDLRTYAMALRSGGMVFLSGFYGSDEAAILSEAGSCGLSLRGTLRDGGWSCLRMEK